MFDSPIEEIKQKINIVDLIQEYIPLRRAGVNFRACCPFHHEKTPSFFVSPERQIFHCFGACQTGGDIFKFVMMMEGMEFGDALRFLAKKAGVQLRRQDPKLQTKRAKLLEILDLASQFYHQALLKSKAGEAAREYVKQRQIDDLIVDQFRLGFAPNLWDELYKFLKRKGFNDNDIFDSGLVVKKQNLPTSYKLPQYQNGVRYGAQQATSCFDRFRNRLMFPIFDVHNSVIGFGGRILPGVKFQSGEEPAKYINTPQTFVYDKSRVLYGLNFAKFEIRKQKKVVIVEGYMDVIASHQVGITNVVAASGTAFTFLQIQLLKRYTEDAVLAFDMDLAGDSATKRGIDLAMSQGLNVKIARVPDGKDPDEFIKLHGKEEWQKIIDTSVAIMDYYFETTFRGLDMKKVEDKKKATAILIPIIANLQNPIEQTHYLQKLAKEIQVAEQDLREYFETYKKQAHRYKKKADDEKTTPAKIDIYEMLLFQLFGLIFKYPQYLKLIIEADLSSYLKEDFAGLYKDILNVYNKNNQTDLNEFSQKLKKSNLDLALKISEGSFYYEKDESAQIDIEKEIKKLICRLKTEILEKKLKEIEEKMAEAEKQKDQETVKKLSENFSQVLEVSEKVKKEIF